MGWRILSLEEIHDIINFEDEAGNVTLLQEIFSSKFAKTGIDVVMDVDGKYEVIEGDTLTVKEEEQK